jgi:DNA polymerase III alpha subunit
MNKYFYDLHIHSCLSPCADNDMTPNNIAGMAALNGLQVIALTDHNSAKNCPAFFEACRRQGLIAIAGVELSTAEDIHLVCLFPELSAAMEFDKALEAHLTPIKNKPEIFGEQLILGADDEPIGEVENLLITATDMWAGEAVEFARSFGAHVHPAHIDRTSNGMIAVLGDIPSEYRFDCVEFKDGAKAEEYYASYSSIKGTATVVSSDAHHLWDINEANNFFMIDDEPYSSALVRRKIFEKLSEKNV